jgi:ElaB/YqjD/DUF883 family membrane-anchored ribosome-binding protein
MAGDTFEKPLKDAVGDVVRGAGEASEHAYETAKEEAQEGTEYAGEIVRRVTSLVQREPWLAIGLAFVLGYATAQLIKRK